VFRTGPGVSLDVVVVDNVSVDGTVEAVRASFPQVRVLANASNVGFAAANNQGAAATVGRYALFLNPDTEVKPGALEHLVAFADRHPDASATTCRLENRDGTLQQSCFHFPSLRMAFYGFFPLVPMDSVANGRYPVETFGRVFEPEHVLGACLMVRRDALERIGGWDEHFFMYFEETDLCYRLHKAGARMLYTPDCSVVHYGGQSTGPVKEEMSVAFYRSQWMFYRKHYSWIRAAALKGIVAIGLVYWLARTLKNAVQGRIGRPLLQTRLRGYGRILVA
jgi:N-acetylglucosaminyl-diphospho-decaprenol L-rhamnosyltransferase